MEQLYMMVFNDEAVLGVWDRTSGSILIGQYVQFVVTTQEKCYQIAEFLEIDTTELDLYFYPEEPIIIP